MNRLNDEEIGQILVAKDYIEESVVAEMLEKAKTQGIPLNLVLYAEDLVSKDLLGQAIAEYYEVTYADLNSVIPSEEQIRIIPEALSRQFNVVIFSYKDGLLVLATDDPKNPQLILALENFATTSPVFEGVEKIQVAYSLTEDIEALFSNYRMPLRDKLRALFGETEISVKKVIDEIFSSAYESKVTDVHFEPKDKDVAIRFRVDGVLQDVAAISSELYEKVVNRIKVLTHLRIDEHFSIQDGSFSHEIDKKHYDLRISFVPTLYGEKLAIRILAQYVGGLSLDQVGLSKEGQENLEEAIRSPFGMIIASGPTGSGKTTTLYSAITKVITPGVNVMTIEDPVEYRIKGATQVQVNKSTGISFSTGLKSLVRQDPDIIMIGEIRDEESAEIAVNAALTGHLLLSTFHANDAATVVPRLLDMGIEPFLLASTLEIIIAQRLVRKLCESCKVSRSVTPAEIAKEHGKDVASSFGKKKTTIYEAKGCSACNLSGYHGRTALFELIPTSVELKELILTSPSSNDIKKYAKKMGYSTMYEDGLKKVLKGTTTISEVMRVAQFNA